MNDNKDLETLRLSEPEWLTILKDILEKKKSLESKFSKGKRINTGDYIEVRNKLTEFESL